MATGNIRLSDANGNQLYTDSMELTERFTDTTLDAEKQIAGLKDPTSLLNLIDWFATRGVRIFFVLLIMLGSRSVLRSLGSRAIRMMVHSREKMDKEDRNDRAETLVSVYSNAVSVSVIGGGLVIMAQEAGIPVGPLLGGVARSGERVRQEGQLSESRVALRLQR